MIERRPSQHELMRMHVEALYTHGERSRIESINQWDGGVAPRFFLGRTKTGNLWRFRADLQDDLAEELERLCNDEPATEGFSHTPAHRDEYIRLLSRHTPIERVSTGPAYWFSTNVVPIAHPVAINDANAELLRGGLEAWLPDVPHRQPFMAIVDGGRAVSVCASVRITSDAHEAGVETSPAYRGKGHAANVVAGWARAVRAVGAIPLYSTSWDNSSSQCVAARLGLSMFGVDFNVT